MAADSPRVDSWVLSELERDGLLSMEALELFNMEHLPLSTHGFSSPATPVITEQLCLLPMLSVESSERTPTKTQMHRATGWGDGLVHTALAIEVWGQSSDTQNPDVVVCVCNPCAPRSRWEVEMGKSTEAHEWASLVCVAVSKRPCLNKAAGKD